MQNALISISISFGSISCSQVVEEPGVSADSQVEEIDVHWTQNGAREQQTVADQCFVVVHPVLARRFPHLRQAVPELVEELRGRAGFRENLVVDRKGFMDGVGNTEIESVLESLQTEPAV